MLSQLVRLVSISHFMGTATCRTLAVMEHYLRQALFVAMFVILHHTRLTMEQPIVARFANKSRRRFIAYLTCVWAILAVLVAICVTLDQISIFLVDYRKNCWLGTIKAKLYLLLLPLAVLLLYNIYNFIQSARCLPRHGKDTRILRLKAGTQNLLICAKLATLVGIPWVSSFFAMLFPSEVAFKYLTFVCCSLQRLYIAIALLFKRKTLNLYKRRWKKDTMSNSYSSKRQSIQTRSLNASED